MIALFLALAGQQATNDGAEAQRWSVLAPSCTSQTVDQRDVVVCGKTPADARLPPAIRDDRGPPDTPPADSMDYRDNAHVAEGAPCAARMGGCQVGFGPPIVPMVVGAVGAVKDALKDRRDAAARRRDGDRRVAIDLDTPPTGHLEP